MYVENDSMFHPITEVFGDFFCIQYLPNYESKSFFARDTSETYLDNPYPDNPYPDATRVYFQGRFFFFCN